MCVHLMLQDRYLNFISGRQGGVSGAMVRGVLRCAEFPYSALMRARNSLYDKQTFKSYPLGRPTISVGNITAGGTGKTPVVGWLAARLRAAGQRPAVLMRGYRRSGGDSDEQMMLQQALRGLLVHAEGDRLAGAQAVIAQHRETTVFILDDGMQHRRAQRDVELVLINATEPFGFGNVHPRGLLREPLAGLRRADAILLTHASAVAPEELATLQNRIRRFSTSPIFHCDHVNDRLIRADDAETQGIQTLALTPWVLFAGIGQPRPLVEQMQRLAGEQLRHVELFPDHHHYTADDLRKLAELTRANKAERLLTTEKDFVKLRRLLKEVPDAPPVWRISLDIRFWDGEEAPLFGLIAAMLRIPASAG